MTCRLTVLATTLALLTSSAAAQCDQLVLTPLDPSTGDHFGIAVDLGGGRLIVGAPQDDTPASFAGSAYVFALSSTGWEQKAKLIPLDANGNDRFGQSVALEGGRAVVGAVFDDEAGNDSGAVYVFELIGGAWVQVQKLNASDAGANDWFGSAVVLEGDMLLVGAPGNDDGGQASGSAYVFELAGGTWSETQKLTASDAVTQAYFGRNVDLSGSRAIVGSNGNDQAYVYEKAGATWTETAILAAPFPLFQEFGRDVQLEGDRCLVTAPAVFSVGPGAYVYEHDGVSWVETAVLVGSEVRPGGSGGLYGWSGALSGDTILVSDYYYDGPGGQDTGLVYVFRRTPAGWLETAKLEGEGAITNSYFGSSLALDGETALVGRFYAHNLPETVHLFELSGHLSHSICDANANSNGGPARLAVSGDPLVAGNCLLLRSTGVPANRFGYYLMARDQAYVPLFGGSQGDLCLALPIVRFAGDILFSGETSAMMFRPDLTALPQGTLFLPGDTWRFQLWFRDANPGNTSNTSEAVAVTFATGATPAVQFPDALDDREEEAIQIAVLVSLSDPAATPVSVPFTHAGTATDMVDYRIESVNPLVVPAGATGVQLLVTIAEDSIQEADETVTITLGNPLNATLGTSVTYTLTIRDDD